MILVASTLAANPTSSKRELLSVLGHLNFAMRIIPQGRPFISHLLTLASSAHALEDQIALTDSCRNELSLWISFVKCWNGLSFFYNNLISSPVDIQLFTDAAPSIGYGGFYQGRWFASTWPCQLSNLPQSSTSLALFELYPIVIAAFLWGKVWSATSIIIHCDNEATVHCVNKSRSHSPMLNPLLRRLIWISACDQFIITARHIPGSKNQIADSLSFFFSEIQNVGTGGGSTPRPSTSLFRTDIPINHPLKPLLVASLNSILQAVSPRTLQSYLTACKSFKAFHSAYNLPFPAFSLLAITSFISHLNINKKTPNQFH